MHVKGSNVNFHKFPLLYVVLGYVGRRMRAYIDMRTNENNNQYNSLRKQMLHDFLHLFRLHIVFHSCGARRRSAAPEGDANDGSAPEGDASRA